MGVLVCSNTQSMSTSVLLTSSFFEFLYLGADPGDSVEQGCRDCCFTRPAWANFAARVVKCVCSLILDACTVHDTKFKFESAQGPAHDFT